MKIIYQSKIFHGSHDTVEKSFNAFLLNFGSMKIVKTLQSECSENLTLTIVYSKEVVEEKDEIQTDEIQRLKHEEIPNSPFAKIVDMKSPTNVRSQKRYEWNNKLHFENWENSMDKKGFKIIGYYDDEQ